MKKRLLVATLFMLVLPMSFPFNQEKSLQQSDSFSAMANDATKPGNLVKRDRSSGSGTTGQASRPVDASREFGLRP